MWITICLSKTNPYAYKARWGNAEVYIPGHTVIFPWEEVPERWNGERWVPARLLKVKFRCIDHKKFGQATGVQTTFMVGRASYQVRP
jgi:hypothetical protein